MNIVWAILITAAVTAVAVAALLLVRRQAPEGGYFEDGDRASGVFGVLATGFSVLLGFIVFLAFASYDQSRAGAEQEAPGRRAAGRERAVLPARRCGRAHGGARLLRALGRQRASGTGAPADGRETRSTRGASSCSARCKRCGRRRRSSSPPTTSGSTRHLRGRRRASIAVHGAVGVIPTPLWIVLFFIAVVIFVFMLFFADRGERAVVQGMLIGSVVSVMTVLLLLLFGLDKPFHGGVGGLQPVAMERSLRIIDEALARGRQCTVQPPCDAPEHR